jgi:predicted ester cyclase
MAVTFTLEFGPEVGTRAQLDEVRRLIGTSTDDTMPAGMLAHLESETPRGFRIVDVWESEDDFARFYAEALEAAFDAAGFRPLDGPPEPELVLNLMLRQRAPSYEATVRALNGAFTSGDVDVLDRYLHADFVDHEETPGFGTDREGAKAFARALSAAFEDLTMEIVDVTSSPGRVACLQRISGRHVGDFMGIPATGRPVDIESLDYFAVDADGLVTDHWGQYDQMAMLTQLGVPAQAAAPAEEQARETRT